MSHIRAAFDPLAKSSAPPQPPPEKRSGRIYVTGDTTHAAGGLQPRPPARSSQSAPLKKPQLLTTLLEEQVVQASCGWRHSALVLDSGSLYVAGDNEHGQLGLGGGEGEGEEEQSAPAVCVTMTCVPGLTSLRVSQVSCGRSHTAFVAEAGELYTMGLGLYGQLGLGRLVSESQPRRVPHVGGAAALVACGDLHTLVLRLDGRALSCGFNDSGRLGRPMDHELENDPNATCAETLGTLPLHVAAAAASEAFAVVALAAGGGHSALVTADGSVYTCGRGEHGQLGHGRDAVSINPAGAEIAPRRIVALGKHKIRRAALGASHSLFLSSQGTPFVCGCGIYGRLGLGNRDNTYVPMPVPSFDGVIVVQISAGAAHSSFVTQTGHVFMCGDDGRGQLGVDGGKSSSLTPVEPPKFLSGESGVRVLGASCGGQHTAFLLRDVVDVKEDYREDQVAAAASVIEAFFRGNHVRALGDAVEKRKKDGRADVAHSAAQRGSASSVIQAGWRLHAGKLQRERREQLRILRQLRGHADDDRWWGRIQNQFDAASKAKVFADAANAARSITQMTW